MRARTRPALSVVGEEDQVPRLATFRAAFPLVRIYTLEDRGTWQAWIPAGGMAGRVITFWHLRDLLDELSRLLGEPTQEDAEIVRLYQGGLSVRAAAARAGLSANRVRAVVLRAGVMRAGRPRRVIAPAVAAEVTKACTSGGMTVQQAAARFGMPAKAVSRILEQRLAFPGDDGSLLPPAAAAALAGTTTPRLSALARAGIIRSARRTAHGHRWYYKADIEALTGRA
jgi:transposase-like protein